MIAELDAGAVALRLSSRCETSGNLLVAPIDDAGGHLRGTDEAIELTSDTSRVLCSGSN